MIERYFVCDSCAHQWNAPEMPDDCENCRHGYVIECATPEEQDDTSERVLRVVGSRRADGLPF